MLRGETLRSMPFFDQKKVVALLDRLPEMDVGARTANDQILMYIVSLCVLQERFGLASGGAIVELAEVGVPAD
jgi:asparagine synthase (glutamine-hydrolysing)